MRGSVEFHDDVVAEEVGVRQTGRAIDYDAECWTLALEARRGVGDLAADGHGVSRFLDRRDPNGANRPGEGDPAHRIRCSGIYALDQAAAALVHVDLAFD